MFERGIVARGLAFACLFGSVAGCASTRGLEASEDGSSAGSVLLSPSLAGVDPRFLPELERIESLIAAGNHVAARGMLDALLARANGGPDGLAGRSLEIARDFERFLDLDPSYLPSLQALAQAVDSGQDREAAAILRRIEMRQPRGQVLEIVEAYRRILDGRAVVAGLRLRLECRVEPAEELPADAPEGTRFARLFLVAESAIAEKVLLETGPATLFVTRSVVGVNGIERDAVETRAFDSLRRLEIGPEAPAEVSLARFFVSAAPGELASRIRFELDVRSGSARILDREVPVMRLRVADAEETVLAPELRELPAAAPEDLVALVSESAQVDLASALAIAVRIQPDDRERTLDLITPRIDHATEDAVRALVPSLRWIAVTSEPGGWPAAWRAWLRDRERRMSGERPNLLLPRRARP